MASIGVEHISVRHGGATVLRDVSVEVADGSVLAVIGPSGSGKSTLLKAIAGIDELAGGRVSFDGVDMEGVSPSDRNIGMVFQESIMYPSRSVRRNVSFPLEVRGLPDEEIQRRVEAEARVLEIERLLERSPRTLSAGHRQLVQAARAFVRAPSVFLMDEPLARLDAKLRATMRREIAALQRGYGVTMVYATNDQIEALALADSMLVLDKGVVRQVGAPMEVYHRPADRFVAEFVGSPPMRFLESSIERDGRGFFLDFLGARLRVWDTRLDEVAERPIHVGVRPEEVSLVDHGGLAGIVTGNEYTGDYGWCSVEVSGQVVMARLDGPPPAVGASVGLEVTALHVFDELGTAVAHIQLPGSFRGQ